MQLDVSFDEHDAISSAVHSRYICLVNTFLIALNHSLLLVSNFINYGAELGCYFVCSFGRQNLSLLTYSIVFKSSGNTGLWASTLPGNIIWNGADQLSTVSAFQTGIGAAILCYLEDKSAYFTYEN